MYLLYIFSSGKPSTDSGHCKLLVKLDMSKAFYSGETANNNHDDNSDNRGGMYITLQKSHNLVVNVLLWQTFLKMLLFELVYTDNLILNMHVIIVLILYITRWW